MNSAIFQKNISYVKKYLHPEGGVTVDFNTRKSEL